MTEDQEVRFRELIRIIYQRYVDAEGSTAGVKSIVAREFDVNRPTLDNWMGDTPGGKTFPIRGGDAVPGDGKYFLKMAEILGCDVEDIKAYIYEGKEINR
jgi:hypothetical protein